LLEPISVTFVVNENRGQWWGSDIRLTVHPSIMMTMFGHFVILLVYHCRLFRLFFYIALRLSSVTFSIFIFKSYFIH